MMDRALVAVDEMQNLFSQLNDKEKFKFLFVNNVKEISYKLVSNKEAIIKIVALKIFLEDCQNRLEFFENCITSRVLNIDKTSFYSQVTITITFSEDYYKLSFKVNDSFYLEFPNYLVSPWLRIVNDKFLEKNTIFQNILKLVEFLYIHSVEEVIKAKNEEIEKFKNKELELKTWYEGRIKIIERDFNQRINHLKNQIDELRNENDKLKNENETLLLKIEKIEEILQNEYVNEYID